MKTKDVKVGGTYVAKVGGKETNVRVDAIRGVKSYRRRGAGSGTLGDKSVYDVTNLATGRKTVFRSASKFRREAVASECGTAVLSAPEPAEPKAVVATVHAGGGIYVDIIDTPKKAMGAVQDILSGRETRESLKPRLPQPNPLVHTPNPKPAPPPEPLALDESDRKVIAERRARLLGQCKVGDRVCSPAMPGQVVTVKQQLPGMVVMSVGGKEETWSPGTEVREAPSVPSPASKVLVPERIEPEADRGSNAESEPVAGSEPRGEKYTPPKPTGDRTPHANPLGIPCETAAKKTKFWLWGIAHCPLFRWIGSRGWGKAEIEALWKSLDLGEAGSGSVGIELRQGAKGYKVPELTPAQAELMEMACGKKPAPAKKGKK